jgi:hypothetical protein
MSHFKIVKVLFNSFAPCPPLNHWMERGSRPEVGGVGFLRPDT